MTNSPTPIIFSKIDYCPNCARKLCKRTQQNQQILIEFRHKGAEIQAEEMTIKCIGCGRKYIVLANTGIIDEVPSGTEPATY